MVESFPVRPGLHVLSFLKVMKPAGNPAGFLFGDSGLPSSTSRIERIPQNKTSHPRMR